MNEQATPTLLERYLKLLELSRDLASTLDLTELLNHIVHSGADLCHAEAASILLYDEPNDQLYFEATSNLDAPLMKGLVVPVGSSIAGWVLTRRQPVIINDAAHDPRHFKQIAQLTNVVTESLLAVPLISKERVVGVLEAINKLEGNFNREDQDLLIALGAQAVVAIENARLFEQSDMIAELVHEVRTPISSIISAATLISDPDITDQQRDTIVNTMLRELNRISEMTSEFLDLAHLESGRIKLEQSYFNIRTLFEECHILVQGDVEKKKQILNMNIPDHIERVYADRDKIKQVIYNLLSNASKYTQANGTITLSIQVKEKEVCIQVADNGVGIAPESIPHIYERFYRAKVAEKSESGTGLGLSICQRIIELHHGRIEVESRLGKGSTFSVFIPHIE